MEGELSQTDDPIGDSPSHQHNSGSIGRSQHPARAGQNTNCHGVPTSQYSNSNSLRSNNGEADNTSCHGQLPPRRPQPQHCQQGNRKPAPPVPPQRKQKPTTSSLKKTNNADCLRINSNQKDSNRRMSPTRQKLVTFATGPEDVPARPPRAEPRGQGDCGVKLTDSTLRSVEV